MTINGSSLETFISKLKSEKPPSQKLGRSNINMHSKDSFEAITAARAKGIDDHLSELLIASKGSKAQYLIPERYFTDTKLQKEFVQKLIEKEKTAALHQYFSQFANKYPVNSLAYYDIMKAGLALQKQVCLDKIEKLQKQSISLISSPRQHFQERREAKKEFQRIQNEQHKLSQSFEKLPDNNIPSESKPLYAIPEEVTTVSEPVNPRQSIPVNLEKGPEWLNETPEALLKRQSTASMPTPMSNTFSRNDSQRTSRTSTTSISDESRHSSEHSPFLVENEEGFSKLNLKHDSIDSINDTGSLDRETEVIQIGFRITDPELIKTYTKNPGHHSVTSIKDEATSVSSPQMKASKQRPLNNKVDTSILFPTIYKP